MSQILSIDPGHRRIAYAGWRNGRVADLGVIHRPKEDLASFISLFTGMARSYDIGLIESQYIKRVGKRKLQTAIAASTMKVMRAAAHCEALMVNMNIEVIWVHPKTWQTILPRQGVSVEVKKMSRKVAEDWIGKTPNQDIADAVTMLKWYLLTTKHIKE